MNKAGGGYQLVCRVSMHVQPRAGARNIDRDRPNFHRSQDSGHFGIVQIDFDSFQLRQFRNFSQYYCRNTPLISAQQAFLARSELAPDRMQQHMGIKIQHSISRPC